MESQVNTNIELANLAIDFAMSKTKLDFKSMIQVKTKIKVKAKVKAKVIDDFKASTLHKVTFINLNLFI